MESERCSDPYTEAGAVEWLAVNNMGLIKEENKDRGTDKDKGQEKYSTRARPAGME